MVAVLAPVVESVGAGVGGYRCPVGAKYFASPGSGSLASAEPSAVGAGSVELPGQLAQLSKCGAIVRWERCEQGHGLRPVRNHCGRLGCPVCYQAASDRGGARARDRLRGMHTYHRSQGVYLGRLRHLVFSPPQDGRATRKDFARVVRTWARGDYGGVVVYHPARKKHVDDGSACEEKKCPRGHVWERGPHWHYVGYGYFEYSDVIFDKAGWVLTDIDYKHPSNKAFRKIDKTMAYLLTHAGLNYVSSHVGHDPERAGHMEPHFSNTDDVISTSGQAYQYVGLMATCHGGVIGVERSEVAKECRTCGAAVLSWEASPDGPPHEGACGGLPVMVDVVRRVYGKREKGVEMMGSDSLKKTETIQSMLYLDEYMRLALAERAEELVCLESEKLLCRGAAGGIYAKQQPKK